MANGVEHLPIGNSKMFTGSVVRAIGELRIRHPKVFEVSRGSDHLLCSLVVHFQCS